MPSSMSLQLVNFHYLSQIVSLSREQGVEELPHRIFNNLLLEQKELAKEWPSLTSNTSRITELHRRLHNLKNCYCNLGCEAAGCQIEAIEQAVKEGQGPDTLMALWLKFKTVSKQTISLLKESISRKNLLL